MSRFKKGLFSIRGRKWFWGGGGLPKAGEGERDRVFFVEIAGCGAEGFVSYLLAV